MKTKTHNALFSDISYTTTLYNPNGNNSTSISMKIKLTQSQGKDPLPTSYIKLSTKIQSEGKLKYL